MSLTAFALNCTLKTSKTEEKSSTDKLLADLMAALKPHGIAGEVVRALDYEIKPGVLSDTGEGDEWPELRRKIIAADLFILGLPICSASHQAWPNEFWSAWMLVWTRRTTKAACLRAERSRLSRSSATKTVPTIVMPRAFRRSASPASIGRRGDRRRKLCRPAPDSNGCLGYARDGGVPCCTSRAEPEGQSVSGRRRLILFLGEWLMRRLFGVRAALLLL